MRGFRAVSVLGLACLAAVFPMALAAQSPQGSAPDPSSAPSLYVIFHAVIPEPGPDPKAHPDPAGQPASTPASVGTAVPQSAERIRWQQTGSRGTIVDKPTSFKLVASNVVVLFQVTPTKEKDGIITLRVESMVWVFRPDGAPQSSLTTLNTLNIHFDEVVMFYPLGRDTDGKASLRLEISVSKTPPADGDTGGK